VVQVAPSGPDQDVNALGQILLTAATIARDRIRIATPYFVPYGTLRAALTHACYRGVRVQLVLPTRSDAPLVLRAGRSYYDELLADGAEIFEYDGGMLHSKVVTVDDRWCMLGSANMDIRSFRLNFEITALVYDSRVAGELSGIIDGYCAKSRRVSRNDRARRRPHTQVIDGAARLFAPLL
jgi:cardiolipin synthase